MSDPNHSNNLVSTNDNFQPSEQIANQNQQAPNHDAHLTPSSVTEQPATNENQVQSAYTLNQVSHPSGNANLRNTRGSRIRVSISYTVSTVSPSRSISPVLATTFANYPRAFENFTSNELINCLTNYENRHIQSFRTLKAQSVPDSADPKAVLYSVSEPDISLRSYVTRLVTYSKAARLHFLMMVIYVDRIAAASIALIPSEENVHRLLAAALALAARQHDALDADHARRVAGLASVDELFKIIDVFLHFINQATAVSRDDMNTAFSRLDAMRHTTEIPTDDNMSTITTSAPAENGNSNEESNIVDDAA